MSAKVLEMVTRKTPNDEPTADHDLLVRIDERVKILGDNLARVGAEQSTRIAALEKEKCDVTEIIALKLAVERYNVATELVQKKDRQDIDWLKSKIYTFIGALFILNLLFGALLVYIFKHLP
jgi:hypothetical protein